MKQPTVVRFASDGRVFVAEKGGKIWIYDSLTDQTPTLFTDLSTRVHDFWDRGLLGMTLDPAFPTKPYVYVLYGYDGDPGEAAPKWGDVCPNPPGATGDGCVISSRLSRFTAAGNVAGAETMLVEGWRQQYPSHSTGQVEFGPDGALYASGGDGASFNFVDYGQDGNPINPFGDPPVAVGQAQTPPSAEGGALRSQSVRRSTGPTLLNGSIIRVDPATGLGLSDNPLAASTDVNAKRVIAYGLRNPFRIATRPGKSELWIADVGWNRWEELNRLPLGGTEPLNFGWPCYEGAGKQGGYAAAGLTLCESLYTAGSHAAPYFAYDHGVGVSSNDDCGRGSSSVTGIAFYNGSSYPAAYQGAMFFADYSRRCIYVMEAGAEGDPAPASARSFHVDADGPVFLTTGPGGDLFYAALTSGTIQRISYLRPAAAFTATPAQGQAPLIVNFDGTKSLGALPTDVLSYEWDLDGDGDFDDSTEAEPAFLYDSIGETSTRLKVTDQRGISAVSQALVIKVTADPPPTSTPPDVFIDTPAAGLRWEVGQSIQFSGHATDAEDGALPASALSWQIVIQHCPSGCHIHDLLSFPGVTSGSFATEDHEYPMHLELILTATDSSGQKRTARRPLDPKTVSLLFDTEPSGLQLAVGSTVQKTPFVRRVIHGSENSVSAPNPQALGGASWKFVTWSDGLAATHALPSATAPARYVAKYQPGGGLMGQYFDQLDFIGTSLTRIDPQVDFNWGTDSPDASLGADSFSVRWTGQILADFAETYTFSTTSDDGIRLSIDSTVVIDDFTAHAPTVDTGTLALTPGWHPVLLEYFENGGGAQVSLSWSSPSQTKQIVPESHLRPGCAEGACNAGFSCNGLALCVPACDPTTCSAGSHCQTSGSACVSLCTDVTCPTGDVCKGDVCVDACVDITCASGQHCIAGGCVDDPPPTGDGGAGGQATGEAGSAGQDGQGGASAEAGGAPSSAGAPVTPPYGGAAGDANPTQGGASHAQGGAAGDANPTQGGAAGGASPAQGGASPTQGGAGPGGEPPTAEGGAPSDPAGGMTNSGAPTEPSGGSVPPSGGCSCTTASSERAPSGLWLLAVGAMALGRRRRPTSAARAA
ncbi:MAG TPA: PA14 domain-containing protein [Polyangiaceae bacterium]|nr:PA14 domain-containing protein [Polyangiaceae bacterium]